MEPDKVAALIQAAMPEATVQVNGADGRHFEATVVSERFAGQRTLQRHRAVYAALGNLVGDQIHALSLRTLTPGELDGD